VAHNTDKQTHKHTDRQNRQNSLSLQNTTKILKSITKTLNYSNCSFVIHRLLVFTCDM